jgi:uncharacterized phage-associated protein
MKAQDISDYLIVYNDFKGDLLTNKKLQKLLYYVEAWALVYTGSLIDEDFEAWVHGPVVGDVYRRFKNRGYAPILYEYPKDSSSSDVLLDLEKKFGINADQKELIETVLEKYGSMSSFQLEMLTHSEKPWLEAREGLGATEHSEKRINKKTMAEYYKSLVG